jgi:hypothetical protein
MGTVKQYEQQITDILRIPSLRRIELGWEYDTVSKARLALGEVRQMQEQLRFVKKSINADIREMRQSYAPRIDSAGAGWKLTGAFLGAKRSASSLAASKKRAIRQQRDAELHPYENLKLFIDGIILELDRLKLEVQTFIEDIKTS